MNQIYISHKISLFGGLPLKIFDTNEDFQDTEV